MIVRPAGAAGAPRTRRPLELGPATMRVEVRPRWAFALPRRLGLDGLTRRRGGVLERLLHREGRPVIVRAAQPQPERVVLGAWAQSDADAAWAIARVRAALGVDQDLRGFHERFRFDPLIGRAVRADPRLRVTGRPLPFEALAWAICEQLIEYERAAAIERRLIARLGARCPRTGLRDSPAADVLAAQAPALLASMDLAPGRALTLIAAAREVTRGRVNLDGDPEAGWTRLRRLRGVGSWTVQMLGLTGQGRLDQIPAGDVSYLKLVGRLLHGHPYARATEAEVEDFFAPYAPWAGLAGAYALRAAGSAASARMVA